MYFWPTFHFNSWLGKYSSPMDPIGSIDIHFQKKNFQDLRRATQLDSTCYETLSAPGLPEPRTWMALAVGKTQLHMDKVKRVAQPFSTTTTTTTTTTTNYLPCLRARLSQHKDPGMASWSDLLTDGLIRKAKVDVYLSHRIDVMYGKFTYI